MPNQAIFDAMNDAQFDAWWERYIASAADAFERLARDFEYCAAQAKRWGHSGEGEV